MPRGPFSSSLEGPRGPTLARKECAMQNSDGQNFDVQNPASASPSSQSGLGPLSEAMLRALAMLGFGLGGVAAVSLDD